ncbi:MAG: BON domain-containing protein [Acidimicrobiia bacterium]
MKKGTLWRSAGIGATVAVGAYLLDPDLGRTRRARLADQAGAIARTAGDRIRARARYQKGVAQGVMHKVSEPFQPPIEVDDDTLLQKIRSEAVGRWQGPKHDLEIDVDNGVVTLRGTASRDRAEELIHLVESVKGVDAVTDEMSVSPS